jgi:hypothetical protein
MAMSLRYGTLTEAFAAGTLASLLATIRSVLDANTGEMPEAESGVALGSTRCGVSRLT